MYIPKHFKPSDEAALEFLSKIESGHLVTNSENGLISTLLPVYYSVESNSLLGHISKLNDQSHVSTQQEALLISSLNQTYISPTWYASKEIHHKVVPTWDYMLIHAYGELITHQDPEWILNQVTHLTNHFEAEMPQPWDVSQAPDDYINGQIRAIVGVQLKLTRIEVSFKMSQNKSNADLNGVVSGLVDVGKDSIASEIENLRPPEKMN
jgi:transcriptional regulator